MKLVMKFGGSLLTDGESLLHVGSLVAKYSENQLIIVVSAFNGVTDQLIETLERAKDGDKKRVDRFLKSLKERHVKVVEHAISGKTARDETLSTIEKLIAELEKVLHGITYLGEFTPRSRDYVLSFGERLSTPIVAGVLKGLGLKVACFTGQEVGMVTDDNFGEANPLMELTTYQVKKKLEPLLEKGIIPVVTGYIAATQHGFTTTLGRGGSDYTATIIAAALNVDEVWIWTNVNGLMTADPKIVPLAKTIPNVSFAEAVEMAVFGAKYMHPKALEPAMEKGIPVRIKNALNPDNLGTVIFKELKVRPGEVVKNVSLVKDIAAITVSGSVMVGAPGTAAKVFDAMGKNNINIFMISQSVSEANISFIVRKDLVEKAVSALEALSSKGIIRRVNIEDDVCVIAVVGAGMKGTPGIAARVFSAVAAKGVNIRMIAQGSSELNISFVVKEKDGEKAIKAIHEEFGLHEGG